MTKRALTEQQAFLIQRQGKHLVDVPELSKDDWMRVYLAYQAFLVQVRAIVWEARHRDPLRLVARLTEPDIAEEAD